MWPTWPEWWNSPFSARSPAQMKHFAFKCKHHSPFFHNTQQCETRTHLCPLPLGYVTDTELLSGSTTGPGSLFCLLLSLLPPTALQSWLTVSSLFPGWLGRLPRCAHSSGLVAAFVSISLTVPSIRKDRDHVYLLPKCISITFPCSAHNRWPLTVAVQWQFCKRGTIQASWSGTVLVHTCLLA